MLNLIKEKELNRVGMQKYPITAQKIIYLKRPKKTLKGNFTEPWGLSGLNPLRSDGSRGSQTGGWTS
jgi:hypothetical protein